MICKEDYENTKSAIDVIAKGEGNIRDLTKFEALVCEAVFGFSGCSFREHAQRLLDLLEYAEQRPEPKQDTLQDVIDDLYKTLLSMDAELNITVPVDIIDRLEAIQGRMGGDGESKAGEPVEISKQKTCPHCGSNHVITTTVITIGEGQYSEVETDLCLKCGYDFTNTRS